MLAVSGLLAPLALLDGCVSGPRGPLPPAVPVVPVAQWGGTPTPAPAQAQRITRLTVHHQGEIWRAGDDVPAYLRRLQAWSRQTKGWVDIPYHYVVSPEGGVYAARPAAIAGDTNTEYNPTGHLLVMLLGNFEEQLPTQAQWDSTVAVVAQLLAQYGLDATAIGSHRDFSAQTVCPGANLYARLDELRAAVAARLRM